MRLHEIGLAVHVREIDLAVRVHALFVVIITRPSPHRAYC